MFLALMAPHTAHCYTFNDYTSAINWYTKIQKTGGLPKVACDKELHERMKHPCLPSLVKRLQITGELNIFHDGEVYDRFLVNAVKRFQENNTIKVDGIVGYETLEQLNLDVDVRLDILKNSQQQYIDLLDDIGKAIVVNIPAYELWAIEDNQLVFPMDVIVGKPDRQTALFSDKIQYADFRPYWNVPTSIFIKDKLPNIQNFGIEYLTEYGFEILDVNGEIIDPGEVNWDEFISNGEEEVVIPYRMRQQPGSNNALGLVKYMFPNKYEMYLHDTPTKRLFYEEKRAYSSGCVRVSDPAKLGTFILDWPLEEVENAMLDEERNNYIVRLSRDEFIPVHLVYLRSWIKNDGTVIFAPDVYGLEEESDEN